MKTYDDQAEQLQSEPAQQTLRDFLLLWLRDKRWHLLTGLPCQFQILRLAPLPDTELPEQVYSPTEWEGVVLPVIKRLVKEGLCEVRGRGPQQQARLRQTGNRLDRQVRAMREAVEEMCPSGQPRG